MTKTFIPCVISNNPEGCSNNTKQCLGYLNAEMFSNIKKYIFVTYVHSSIIVFTLFSYSRIKN